MSKAINQYPKIRESAMFYYIKTALILSPAYIFGGGFILWFYLNEIGMITIFKDVLDSKPELIASLFSFVIISISFTAMMIYPSVSICQLYFIVGPDNLRREVNSAQIPLVTILSIFTTLSFIFIIAWIDTLSTYLNKYPVTSLILLLSIVSSLLTYFIKRKKQHWIYKNGNFIKYKKSIWVLFIVALFILFTGITIALPLSFIFKLGSVYTKGGIFNTLFLSIIISLLSLFPAIMFYSKNATDNNIYIKTKQFTISSLVIFVLILFLLPNLLSVICSSALKAAGIIDKTEHAFAIDKSSYSPSMFPTPVWKHIGGDDEKFFYIKGTILFSLEETVLLCPDFVVKTQNNYMKNNFDKIIPDNNSIRLRHLRETFKSCATIKKSAIFRWDTIMDKGNKLNM